jgi:hypothetical protein
VTTKGGFRVKSLHLGKLKGLEAARSGYSWRTCIERPKSQMALQLLLQVRSDLQHIRLFTNARSVSSNAGDREMASG